MAFSFSMFKNSFATVSRPSQKLQKVNSEVYSHSRIKCDILTTRRNILISTGSLLIPLLNAWGSAPLVAKAGTNNPNSEIGGDEGVIESLKSLLDPNEKTKMGKVLPKAYLKSAREVVKTLRESLDKDSKDVAKFRRSADAAKESIREFLSGWRGQSLVSAEESYIAIEKAIRSLAGFYSKAGPFASMPDDIKSGILDDLKTAESFL